jgi:aryl-alcohol dehydrogenase-like predicted oxidoreductase
VNRNRIGSLEVSGVGLGGNSFGTDFFGARCHQRQVRRISNAAAADWQLGAEDLAAIDAIVAHEAEIEDLEDLR